MTRSATWHVSPASTLDHRHCPVTSWWVHWCDDYLLFPWTATVLPEKGLVIIIINSCRMKPHMKDHRTIQIMMIIIQCTSYTVLEDFPSKGCQKPLHVTSRLTPWLTNALSSCELIEKLHRIVQPHWWYRTMTCSITLGLKYLAQEVALCHSYFVTFYCP